MIQTFIVSRHSTRQIRCWMYWSLSIPVSFEIGSGSSSRINSTHLVWWNWTAIIKGVIPHYQQNDHNNRNRRRKVHWQNLVSDDSLVPSTKPSQLRDGLFHMQQAKVSYPMKRGVNNHLICHSFSNLLCLSIFICSWIQENCDNFRMATSTSKMQSSSVFLSTKWITKHHRKDHKNQSNSISLINICFMTQ